MWLLTMTYMRRKLLTMIDVFDHFLCRVGLLDGASFFDLENAPRKALYAGRLSRHLPQFANYYIGLTPFFPSSRNVKHDATKPLPLPDNYLDLYQSEDVFEHIEYRRLVAVFDEIHRVLKPGGVFRLSLPDYRFDEYSRRSVRDENGSIVFDPGGGGLFKNGKVVQGGHVWFPTYELVKDLFDQSAFNARGSTDFLQYTASDGSFVMNPINFELGYVQRVPGNDKRVAQRPRPISIVVDAQKAR